MNLIQIPTLDSLTKNKLTWTHPPSSWDVLPDGGMRVYVPGKVDYFQDPSGKISKDDAPYLWMHVTGDFIARAHVRPNWTTTYDAAALMVRHDARTWVKVCYESTDFGTTAAVSVVTRQVSDDANGVDLKSPDIWLQVARQDGVIGLHYALDGKSWRMVRLFHLNLPDEVKVGLVAQCPIGPGAAIDFLSFSIINESPVNIRSGF